ncbi:hypothetical protein KQX54_006541 [Cotesia glomerata]|uniref:Uncharacterized protein n=1 Tax=Cotesia glomerata TaxID=32391 RepID=A0AAV7IL87_COTGL|nr:hypothetical protein KQX54_006541 [Cotesia glomerata]
MSMNVKRKRTASQCDLNRPYRIFLPQPLSSPDLSESTRSRIRAHHQKIRSRSRLGCTNFTLDLPCITCQHCLADNRKYSSKVDLNNQFSGHHSKLKTGATISDASDGYGNNIQEIVTAAVTRTSNRATSEQSTWKFY